MGILRIFHSRVGQDLLTPRLVEVAVIRHLEKVVPLSVSILFGLELAYKKKLIDFDSITIIGSNAER